MRGGRRRVDHDGVVGCGDHVHQGPARRLAEGVIDGVDLADGGGVNLGVVVGIGRVGFVICVFGRRQPAV